MIVNLMRCYVLCFFGLLLGDALQDGNKCPCGRSW